MTDIPHDLDDAYDPFDDTPEGEPRYPSAQRRKEPDVREGAVYKALRQQFRHQCRTHRNSDGSYGKPCSLCHKPIDYGLRWPHRQSFSVDHAIPVRLAPERALDMNNFRPAHMSCNRARDRRLEDDRCNIGTPSEVW
jgi:5-methylcytosine-specific restriction endonuclease McrA